MILNFKKMCKKIWRDKTQQEKDSVKNAKQSTLKNNQQKLVAELLISYNYKKYFTQFSTNTFLPCFLGSM